MKYEKGIIKTGRDLPKEEGEYIANENGYAHICPFNPEDHLDFDYWIAHFDWYLQPLPEQESKELTDLKQYVAGFMFTNDCKNVILIRKKKPLWQEGKLNGVGGKIELNETPLNAMIREYHEEAGIMFDKWDNFLTVKYKSCIVYFFKGFSDSCFYQSETKEIEIIEKISIDKFPSDEVIPNLNWIINLALDSEIQYTEAIEEYFNRLHTESKTSQQIESELKSIAIKYTNDNGIDYDEFLADLILMGYEYAQSHPEAREISDEDIVNAATEYAEGRTGQMYRLMKHGYVRGATEMRDNKIYISPKSGNIKQYNHKCINCGTIFTDDIINQRLCPECNAK